MVRRQILEHTFTEPIAPGSDRLFRDFPLSRLDSEAIEVLRDRKIDVPGSANERLKAIREVFKFGVKKKWSGNPARDVEYFQTGSTGWHAWTVDEVAQYQERHPIGTKARLALDLIMFTGVRKSDAIRMGRQHAKRGKFVFTQRHRACLGGVIAGYHVQRRRLSAAIGTDQAVDLAGGDVEIEAVDGAHIAEA